MTKESNIIKFVPLRRSAASLYQKPSDFFTRDDVLEIYLARKALEEAPTIAEQFKGKTLVFVNE